MKYRRLGSSGLAVSPISLGTMGFAPPLELSDATRLIGRAHELGVNLIDTANCYDGPHRNDEGVQGHAEQYLGRIFQENPWRDDFIILTKAATPMRDGPQHCGLSATHLLRELEGSLKRLRMDCVDIFMLHHRDAYADPATVLEALDTARVQGKARAFGISNHPALEVCEFLWQADKGHGPKLCASEIPINPLNRRYQHDLTFYERHQVGVAVLQPLQGGLLTNKFVKGAKQAVEKTMMPGWAYHPDEETLDKIQRLHNLAVENTMSLPQLSMKWSLAQPAVATLTVGARNLDNLESAVEAASDTLSQELIKQVNEISPAPDGPLVRFERD